MVTFKYYTLFYAGIVLQKVKTQYRKIMPKRRVKRHKVYAIGAVVLSYAACGTALWVRFRDR